MYLISYTSVIPSLYLTSVVRGSRPPLSENSHSKSREQGAEKGLLAASTADLAVNELNPQT
jgi:hypothetical protein